MTYLTPLKGLYFWNKKRQDRCDNWTESWKELYLSVSFILRWSTNWGHCKLKLTINTNQVKCWFLRRGETGVPEGNLSVQSREPTIEPGPQWWEASALTTAPSLHPPTVIQPERCPAQRACRMWLARVSRAFHYRFNQEPRRVPFHNPIGDAFYSHQKAGLL